MHLGTTRFVRCLVKYGYGGIKNALTKNAILVTFKDRAKRTKIWDHKAYMSQIRNIFKNSKFYEKNSKWPP